jgi:succinyl-diaminopimelate desuccinylase
MAHEEHSRTLSLAISLIEKASVTPDDMGCNQLMMDRLEAIGFRVEPLCFGAVNNFWARLGNTGPLLCFAGHTDVVPAGPLDQWRSPPFSPTLKDGMLYGRGAADMKGSLAAMVTACERFTETLKRQGKPSQGSIAFLITSDEEGAALNGTRKVIEVLEARQEKIDYCIVGEPSSSEQLGDTIKIGRRGSLHGRLTFLGVQGHIAYPQLADNPVHFGLAPLQALCAEVWDEGNAAFPPTSFQISNLNAGTGTDNVIPGTLEVMFNFRYSTASTEAQLKNRVTEILSRFTKKYSLDWHLSGEPFLTEQGRLIDIAIATIAEIRGIHAQTSTSGGTSDGRFIAPTGAQLIELGPCNTTIHKVNECTKIEEIDELSIIYERILEKIIGGEDLRR